MRWIDSSPELTVPILVKNARIVPNHLESKCEVTQKMCEYALTYCSLNDEETVSAILWTLCHNFKMISGFFLFFFFFFLQSRYFRSLSDPKKKIREIDFDEIFVKHRQKYYMIYFASLC